MNHTIIRKKVEQTKHLNLYRESQIIEGRKGSKIKTNGRWLVDFSSNDYLGLSQHPSITKVIKNNIEQMGYGSASAHLLSGHSKFHQQLEHKVAEFLGSESALLFSTGYMANIAIQQVLLGRQDIVIHDKLNHASLLDGAKLSDAKLHRYKHLDMADLEKLLIKHQNSKLVVTDGVFSMDGDQCNTKKLNELTKNNNCYMLVDDAHGFGVVGNGRGSYHLAGLEPIKHRIQVVTLGKALGCHGALIVGDSVIINALKQYGRSYIYTTAAPAINSLATLESLAIVNSEEGEDLRLYLDMLIARLRSGLKELNFELLNSQTPIQLIMVGETDETMRLSQKLNQAGFYVPTIRPPTVKKGKSRLRITITAKQSIQDIDLLLENLASEV